MVLCGFCKNCKYWNEHQPDPDLYYPVAEMGTCTNNINFHKEYSEVKDKSIYKNGAIIESDEGWCWATAPEFGCVHFSQK